MRTSPATDIVIHECFQTEFWWTVHKAEHWLNFQSLPNWYELPSTGLVVGVLVFFMRVVVIVINLHVIELIHLRHGSELTSPAYYMWRFDHLLYSDKKIAQDVDSSRLCSPDFKPSHLVHLCQILASSRPLRSPTEDIFGKTWGGGSNTNLGESDIWGGVPTDCLRLKQLLSNDEPGSLA